jgi:2-polyprenyl-3-methyl-5-hydroxy-6-metoxy-1,4-benzoquinol methylase
MIGFWRHGVMKDHRPDGSDAEEERASDDSGISKVTSDLLSARLEPFDSYWQAPDDVESGYSRFAAYYRSNYLGFLPKDRSASILVISCGPGYLVDVLQAEGYENVLGIDSDPAKIEYAKKRGLNCIMARAFEFLQESEENYDVVIPEQELSHLTHDETLDFLGLCRGRMNPGARLISYTLNGANPLVGAENLAHNIDHFYTVTEYSYKQLLELSGFQNVSIHPLKLYVFWKNPLNYVGLVATSLIEFTFRLLFALYGKKCTVLTKKILATCEK